MLFDDQYTTLEKCSESLFKDKGSKFLGFAYPISKESEVKQIVTSLRAEHSKARHFCWAFRLTQDRSVFRLNDDGEPSGTAGRPILNTLLSQDLTNVLVVVVRYFGGTLLGVPGLINAYKTATLEAINAGQRITKSVNDIYELTFPYLKMNDVMKIIKEHQLQITLQSLNDHCQIQLEIRKTILNAVLQRFSQLGDVDVRYVNTI
jgi:uncharacterized YigZ family protein